MSEENNEGLLKETVYQNPALSEEGLAAAEAEVEALEKAEADKAQALIDAAKAQEFEEEAAKENPLGAAQQHDYEKRYKDLQRFMSKKQDEHKEEVSRLQAQLEERDVRLPKSAAELEAFKEAYPDIYGTIETVAALKSNETAKEYEERIAAVEKREQEVAQRNALLEVKKVHTDLEEVVTTSDFVDWVNEKTESGSTWVKQAVYGSNEASEVIDAVSLYKREKGIDAPKKRGRPRNSDNSDAASKVTTGRSDEPGTGQEKVYTKADIQKMSDEEFLKLDAEGAFRSVR